MGDFSEMKGQQIQSFEINGENLNFENTTSSFLGLLRPYWDCTATQTSTLVSKMHFFSCEFREFKALRG